jgi:predicted Zn-dependent protease
MPLICRFALALTLLLLAFVATGCTEWLAPRPVCRGENLDLCLPAQTLLEPLTNETCEGTEKRLCIVPLGQVSPALVSHLADHYRSEYGLTVEVLTPTAITADLVNREREQIEVDGLFRLMASVFPDTYADPDTVMIGLTPVDLYWLGKPSWRYAFGVRGDREESIALISSARMDPQIYGLPEDDELYFTRVRKMVSKYVGFLYFGLPESSDPESPMFDNILGPDDLDRMEEPLPVE